MPSGGVPKVYPADLVAEVSRLYELGHSQTEVAEALRLTQKVIWKLMLRHGLRTRPQIKRDQRGEKNAAWKGRHATYKALHVRVGVRLSGGRGD